MTFPFSVLPELESVLRAQWEMTKAVERETRQVIPWVFHRDGKPIRYFRRSWARACLTAGLGQIDPETEQPRAFKFRHDFRRTAVRNLERAGVPRSVAMKLTGHKTESVYRRYAIAAERESPRGRGQAGRAAPDGRRASATRGPTACSGQRRRTRALWLRPLFARASIEA